MNKPAGAADARATKQVCGADMILPNGRSLPEKIPMWHFDNMRNGTLEINLGGGGGASFATLTGSPMDNAALAAALAEGGGGVSLPGRVWVETGANGGSDGTGEVGNPGRPFATMAAAYAAGARVFHLGAGTFAGITQSAALDIACTGLGASRTVMTMLRAKGQALTLTDLGSHSFACGTVSTRPDDSAEGQAGTDGGTMTLVNVKAASVILSGGHAGSPIGPGDGLKGGDGGHLTVHGHVVLGSVEGNGGNATDALGTGEPEGGYNGADGGRGGSIGGTGLVTSQTVTLNGGGVGYPVNNAAPGLAGSGGSIHGLMGASFHNVTMHAGTPTTGTYEAPGTIEACHHMTIYGTLSLAGSLVDIYSVISGSHLCIATCELAGSLGSLLNAPMSTIGGVDYFTPGA